MSDYKMQSFRMGDLILEEGDAPRCAYVIKSGSVQIIKKRRDGSELVLSSLKQGDIFGEMGLIDAEPRSASVRATDDVSLIVVDAPTFKEKQDALDVFSKKLVQTLISRLRVQNQQLADLTEPSSLLKAAQKGQIDKKGSSHTNVLIKDDYREKTDFGSIRFLMGDANPQARQGIKGGLHMQGFREIDDISNPNDFKKRVANESYDLILMDGSLGVPHIAEVIKNIRHGKTSVSPFCVIFGVIDQPDPATLEKLAEAGLDDVLVKPVALGNIIDRVERRIKQRKPFVVTLEYVGPDRRSGKRPNQEVIPLVQVPNPLAYKALPRQDAKEFEASERQALMRIEELKLERHAVQIDWLRGKIATQRAEGQSTEFFMEKLITVTGILIERLSKKDEKSPQIPVCENILSMMDDFEAGMAEMDGQDWEDFSALTRRLRTELKPAT
ncbi:cyclic nucleotide-binding domain-containing protein [Terasakiella sp. A23]|uniref:cyclic nucleotide-binding domain-containing protein n=1 Tax=Terasakiella sp. FCG-A23 TaxID=3080561 RepID=UPI002953FB56|nr:cyclic nucleotide-binding domain-containing protein [Terasakiella sp. A23]MDV7341164.1 cyclic nucleotide-binding domain-containing protein [Terasakiella sp. A23]